MILQAAPHGASKFLYVDANRLVWLICSGVRGIARLNRHFLLPFLGNTLQILIPSYG